MDRGTVSAIDWVSVENEVWVGWNLKCIHLLAVFEFKIILATLIRSLEFHETEANVEKKIAPTLQPVTDGKAGVLPLYITLVNGNWRGEHNYLKYSCGLLLYIDFVLSLAVLYAVFRNPLYLFFISFIWLKKILLVARYSTSLSFKYITAFLNVLDGKVLTLDT